MKSPRTSVGGRRTSAGTRHRSGYGSWTGFGDSGRVSGRGRHKQQSINKTWLGLTLSAGVSSSDWRLGHTVICLTSARCDETLPRVWLVTACRSTLAPHQRHHSKRTCYSECPIYINQTDSARQPCNALSCGNINLGSFTKNQSRMQVSDLGKRKRLNKIDVSRAVKQWINYWNNEILGKMDKWLFFSYLLQYG